MNLFRFLNVGQGLFYSGRIGIPGYYYHDLINHFHYCFSPCETRFVFDCGSESHNHEEYLQRAIHNDFYKNEKIDFVVLSHLHDDHINGFELLSNYTDIKSVILPYMYNDTILCSYLAINTNEDLIHSDENFLEKKIRYIRKLYENDLYSRLEWSKVNNNPNVDDNFHELYCTKLKENSWEFVIINKRINQSIIDNIYNDIMKLVGNVSILDFIKNKNNLNEIKAIYKKYLKNNINLSSIVMLHHPKYDLDNVSVLTGDAEFDDNMINEITRYLKDNPIKFLQIPHHGSKKNWNSMKQIKNQAINLYVSYGIGNNYKHPSSSVIEDIHLSGRPLFSSVQSLYFLFPWNEYKIE